MDPEPIEDVRCPYCGEPTGIHPDADVGHEEFVEDCTVCCRPIQIRVDWDGERPILSAQREDGM